MPKKIMILINSLRVGGAEKQSVLLATALVKEYNVVYVVLDSKNCKESFLNILQSDQRIELKLYNENTIKIFTHLYRLIKDNKPDIIFSYLPFGNLINGVLGKLLGVKWRIGGIRNDYTPELKHVIQKHVHNFLLTNSISNSLTGKKSHWAVGYTKKPIFHIPNVFPLHEKPIIRNNKNSIKIISVGRFVDQKNYGLALDCIKACHDLLLRDNAQLVMQYQIIGYGILENEIRKMVKQRNLEDVVEIVISPNNINEYYKASDIYLCTSKFEGLSNSIMEAMSFSLPIIATNVGGNAELIEDDINGFLTDQSTLPLVDKIMELVKDEKKRIIMGQESYSKIKENYSEEIFFKRYRELIESDFKSEYTVSKKKNAVLHNL